MYIYIYIYIRISCIIHFCSLSPTISSEFLLFPNHTSLLELPVSFHPPENQGMAAWHHPPWRVCSLKLTVCPWKMVAMGDDPSILGVSASFSVVFAVSFRQGIWTDSFNYLFLDGCKIEEAEKKQLLRKWQPMKQGKHGKWFQSIWSKSYQSIRMISK